MMNLLKSFGPGAKQFVAEHKHWLLLVGLAALVFGGGMAAGRYLTPPSTVIVEKTVVQYQDKIVVQTQVQTKIVYVKDKQQEAKTHTVTVVTENKDGSKVTTTTKDTDTATKTQTNKDTDVDKSKVATEVKYVDRVTEKQVTVTVDKQPNWRLSADLGLSLPYYLYGQSMGTPSMQGLVVGVEGDRRIAGPFWAGIRADTLGTVGLSLSFVF